MQVMNASNEHKVSVEPTRSKSLELDVILSAASVKLLRIGAGIQIKTKIHNMLRTAEQEVAVVEILSDEQFENSNKMMRHIHSQWGSPHRGWAHYLAGKCQIYSISVACHLTQMLNRAPITYLDPKTKIAWQLNAGTLRLAHVTITKPDYVRIYDIYAPLHARGDLKMLDPSKLDPSKMDENKVKSEWVDYLNGPRHSIITVEVSTIISGATEKPQEEKEDKKRAKRLLVVDYTAAQYGVYTHPERHQAMPVTLMLLPIDYFFQNNNKRVSDTLSLGDNLNTHHGGGAVSNDSPSSLSPADNNDEGAVYFGRAAEIEDPIAAYHSFVTTLDLLKDNQLFNAELIVNHTRELTDGKL